MIENKRCILIADDEPKMVRALCDSLLQAILRIKSIYLYIIYQKSFRLPFDI